MQVKYLTQGSDDGGLYLSPSFFSTVLLLSVNL
uniref:Uncharacterized protein n=1 Tax=Anguilla anguilla TaxID=7936 RepID=A0A0E9QH91_ANGAN